MGGIVGWLKSFTGHIRTIALGLGGPGLFLVTFLDSSFLSLPELADLLVVWMVTRNKPLFLYYALCATLGSIAGCVSIYYVAKKGGEALLAKRFNSAAIEKGRATLQRHGILAVLIPSLLPPPAPFKIFVLLAGVAEIPVTRFTIAIAIGRGGRYLIEALLAVWIGDQALAFIEGNTQVFLFAVLGLICAGGVGYWLWQRRQRADT
jgi:membrane protein YqaA with SNARE-associated domain